MINHIFRALSAAQPQSELNMPLHKELWQYFYDTYINPSEYYENLGIGSETMFSVRLIIIGLVIGLSLAAFSAVFNKRILGDVVRRILGANALSAESALTLDELGYGSNLLVRLAVKKSTSLRRVVKCREEEKYDNELRIKGKEYQERRKNGEKIPRFKEIPYKINTLTDAFFIPEKMKYMADVKFEKKGSTWLGAVIATVIMAIVCIAVIILLPDIFSLLNDFAAGFKS